MRPHSALHRLVAIVPAVLMVVAGLVLAPTASAASPSPYYDRSGDFRFEIHKDDTVDFALTMRNENAGLNQNCDTSYFDNFFGDEMGISVDSGDNSTSCTVSFEDLTLEQFNDNMPGKITHEDESFTFEMNTYGLDSFGQVTVEATFPGNVSEVSERGEKSGNTATWNNVQDETGNLTAKGADHIPSQGTKSSSNKGSDQSSILLVIIITVAVTALIGGGIIIFVVIRRRRARAAIAPGMGMGQPQPGYQPGAGQPGYPQPGQQPYNPQPGHPQPAPGQTAPGYPGYTQPDAQPGRSQPGQRPYSPQADYPQSGQPGSPNGPYGYDPNNQH